MPFTNGMLGFLSYGAGESLQLKKNTYQERYSSQDELCPFAFFGHYTWSYVYDRVKQQGQLSFSPLCSSTLRDEIYRLLNATLSQPENTGVDQALSTLDWKKSQSFSDYEQQFSRIQNYIQAGDCYQVNLTQRFESSSGLDAAVLYFATQDELQTPYSCFMSFAKDQHLLSFSPEQFIQIKNNKVTTRPIKGTIENTGSPIEADSLRNSAKNQAENVMIVDLLRNDLGKVCKANTVKVAELFKIETYKNVHHLVSHIQGELKAGIEALDAFLSCFPGGSITGAPKVRAMEIISELEVNLRQAYCGSVFYLNHDGQFDSNILIRSVIKNKDALYCWAGGGLVADSELRDEYQESLTKVSNITNIKR